MQRSMLAYRRARRFLRVPADTYPTPTATACSPTSASDAGGTTITVTGTGFVSSWGQCLVDSVKFGGTHATSFVVVSAVLLTAVTPAHAVGPVTVIVETSGGTAMKASGVTFT